jgi:ATP-binding cassette subfamily B protein
LGFLEKCEYITRIGLYMTCYPGAIGLGVLNMRYTTNVSMGFGANLRNALFEKIQDFSFNNIDHFSTASLITRLTNDVNNLQVTVMMVLRLLLRAPLMLMIAFFLAYSINARLSMVLAVAIPLLAVGVLVILKTAVARYSIVQEKIDLLNNTLQENLIGMRVVKSYVREDYEIAKFKISSDNLTDAAIGAASIAIINFPLLMLVLTGATLAIIWMGGRMVFSSSLTTGELISFLSYIMQILMSVMMISMVILMGARAEASGRRIVEVLDTEIDIVGLAQPVISSPTIPATKAGKVEFRNVSFKYHRSDTGENVLSGISFTAQPGQVIGIVGGTVPGKHLVHLIPRLYDVTEGTVLVDDVDVRDYSLETLRDKIGVALQKNTLFSGTIRENILWGNPDATEGEMIAACQDAQAHDFIMSFPNGYDTLVRRCGVSGGQKQRLCIARAMLVPYLILDDSTSAVDSSTGVQISALRSITTLYNCFYHRPAHQPVCDADQILVLDDGKVAGMGTSGINDRQSDLSRDQCTRKEGFIMTTKRTNQTETKSPLPRAWDAGRVRASQGCARNGPATVGIFEPSQVAPGRGIHSDIGQFL